MAETEDANILTPAADIVPSYVRSGAHLKADEIPGIPKSVRAMPEKRVRNKRHAAVETDILEATKAQLRTSIGDDHVISFIDNKPYKTLKRHLRRHSMSVSDYRERYGLPSNYPSVSLG